MSPDGSTLAPGSGHSLVNSFGTWTFSDGFRAGGNIILLNDVDTTGSAAEMKIANGGQLYVHNILDSWFVYDGAWEGIPAIPTPTPVPTPSTKVHLSWNPSDAASSEAFGGYHLFWGIAPNTPTVTLDAGAKTDFSVSVPLHTPIYFSLATYNVIGRDGPRSDELLVPNE